MTYLKNNDIQSEDTLLELARKQGEQTLVTEKVKAVAKEIDPKHEVQGEKLTLEVCDFVMTMIPSREDLLQLYQQQPNLKIDKRLRTADELLDESNLLPDRMRTRNISGCIETGHVVRALLLAKGIPCVYTETLQKEWCEHEAASFEIGNPETPPMQGHIFIDVYLENEGRWITVDPSGGKFKIHKYKDYSKNGKDYIYARSAKDSWDLGYKSMRAFQEEVVSYFKSQHTSNP